MRRKDNIFNVLLRLLSIQRDYNFDNKIAAQIEARKEIGDLKLYKMSGWVTAAHLKGTISPEHLNLYLRQRLKEFIEVNQVRDLINRKNKRVKKPLNFYRLKRDRKTFFDILNLFYKEGLGLTFVFSDYYSNLTFFGNQKEGLISKNNYYSIMWKSIADKIVTEIHNELLKGTSIEKARGIKVVEAIKYCIIPPSLLIVHYNDHFKQDRTDLLNITGGNIDLELALSFWKVDLFSAKDEYERTMALKIIKYLNEAKKLNEEVNK